MRGCLCARWRYRSRLVKSMLFTKCCVIELQLAVVMRITDNTAEVLPITASLMDTENGGGGLPRYIRLYLRLRGLITDKLYLSRLEVQLLHRPMIDIQMNIISRNGLNNKLVISLE